MVNVFTFWLWAALLLNIGLGVVVCLANPRRTVNRHYVTLALVVGVWLASNLAVLTSRTEEEAGFWIRMATASVSLIPTCCYILRLCILNPRLGWWPALGRGGWLLLANASVVVVVSRPGFVLSVQLPSAPGEVAEPLYGKGFTVFAVFFILVILLLGFLFFRDRGRTSGAQRAEMDFLILGSLVALTAGTALSLLPALLVQTSRGVPLANAMSAILFDVSVAYGVANRRIMPVAEILRRATGHMLLALYVVLVYLAIWFAADRTGALLVGGGPHFFAHLLAAVTAALAAGPLRGRTQMLAGRLFTGADGASLTRSLQDASRMLQSVTTVDSLVGHLGAFVRRAVTTDRCLVLLRGEHGTFTARGEGDDASPPRLSAGDPLLARLEHQREPLVLDAVARRRTTAMERAAAARLRELGGQIALGIYGKADLEGVLVLGARRGGTAYGAIEQDALQILCNQAAIAIENASLYTRIQREKEDTEHLLDNLMSGVIAVDGVGDVVVFNREARRILGVADDGHAKPPAAGLPPPFAELARRLLESGTPWQDREVSVPRGDGMPLVARVSGAVLGEVALLVFHDVTRLRALEEQVRRTDRLASMGTLSAGMAHEIRNPLVSIKTFAQLLPTRYEDPDFRDTFTPIIAHEVERLDGLVKQLLDFARPRDPELAPMSLHELLRESVKLARHRLRSGRVDIVEAFEAPSDRILGDAGLLEQALLNLFLNAGDAMEGEGCLTLRTSAASDDRIAVEVSDTGHGIEPKDLAHVFDPFFTTKPAGTGLGLSVVHGILEDHGATVEVASRLGEGTTFTLVFRLAPPEETA